MSGLLQDLLVIAAVLIAAGYLLRLARRAITPKHDTACGCSGCGGGAAEKVQGKG